MTEIKGSDPSENKQSHVSLAMGLAWSFGLAFLTLPVAILCLNTGAFFLGLHSSGIPFWISVVASSYVLNLSLKHCSVNGSVRSFLLVTFWIILTAMIAASGAVFDSSTDGQVYHQEYTILLHDGWNPIWELTRPSNFYLSGQWYWNYVYTKGSEIVGSCLYCAFNRIETAKAIHWIWYAASLLLSWCLFYVLSARSRFGHIFATLAAVLAASNPVAICQIFTFYIDGEVGSALLCLLSIFGIMLLRPTWKSTWYGVALTIVYLINLKIYCCVYVGIFVIVGTAALYGCTRDVKVCRRFFALSTLACVAGLTIGFNPYLSGILEKHDFQYTYKAVSRAEAETELVEQSPVLLNAKYPLLKLVLSLFCRTCNEVNWPPLKSPLNRPIVLLSPFAVGDYEQKRLVAPDTRVGGFGPWFGEILVLSLLITVVFIMRRFVARRLSKQKEIVESSGPQVSVALWLAFIASIMVAVNPMSWWARYVPQLWVIPLMLLAAYTSSNRSAISKFVATLVIALYIVDCGYFALPNLQANLKTSSLFSRDMAAARLDCQRTGQTFFLCTSPYTKFMVQSVGVRLKEHGISYQLTEMPPAQGDRVYFATNLWPRLYMPSVKGTSNSPGEP